jgi:hypothetical protein
LTDATVNSLNEIRINIDNILIVCNQLKLPEQERVKMLKEIQTTLIQLID